jgi:ankyrin repeat protein
LLKKFLTSIYYSIILEDIKKNQKIIFVVMCVVRVSVLKILLLVAILLCMGNMYGQPTKIDSLSPGLSVIDTSDYIPIIFEGALECNLMIAASKGYDTEIIRLIGKGARINVQTNEGATALIFAVVNNRLSAVKTLITFYPDLDKVTTSYETPLLIAVKNQNFEISEALIRAGADIDFPDRLGASPLHHASLNGYLDIVDLLLYYDASINEKTDEGTTPLLASIWAGYGDVADLLIQNGADIEASDNEGFTPFLMAALNGDTLLMDLLFKKGVDIYATNNSYHNALTLSILAGNSETTEFILKKGDKWINSGRNALNPYRVASGYRRKESINILEKYNVPGKIKYGIDQVALNISSRFFLNDFYSGVSLSFKEPYLNGGFITGCDTKLWYTKVLVKNSENLYYQYMDKGSVAYAGLFKDFALTDRLDKCNFAFSTSLLAGYSFGNKLKGTLLSPGNKFMVIPSISLKMTKMDFALNLGLEYQKTEFYHTGPVWLRIGCSYNYFFDQIRTHVKTIKWY